MKRLQSDNTSSLDAFSDSLSSYSKITEMDTNVYLAQSSDIDSQMQQEIETAPEIPAKKVATLPKGRKSKEIVKVLIQHYHMYEGHWDESNFKDLIHKTGYTKKQLNKWFWDRKERQREQMEAKKLSYPGLIFQITDTRTGNDLTPDLSKICCKPIFKIEKINR